MYEIKFYRTLKSLPEPEILKHFLARKICTSPSNSLPRKPSVWGCWPISYILHGWRMLQGRGYWAFSCVNGWWDPPPGSLPCWHLSIHASVQRPTCHAEAVPAAWAVIHRSTGAAAGWGAQMPVHPASMLAPSCVPWGWGGQLSVVRSLSPPPCAAHTHSHEQNLLLLPLAKGQPRLPGPGHHLQEGRCAAGWGGIFQRGMCQHSSKPNSPFGACEAGSCWCLRMTSVPGEGWCTLMFIRLLNSSVWAFL